MSSQMIYYTTVTTHSTQKQASETPSQISTTCIQHHCVYRWGVEILAGNPFIVVSWGAKCISCCSQIQFSQRPLSNRNRSDVTNNCHWVAFHKREIDVCPYLISSIFVLVLAYCNPSLWCQACHFSLCLNK